MNIDKVIALAAEVQSLRGRLAAAELALQAEAGTSSAAKGPKGMKVNDRIERILADGVPRQVSEIATAAGTALNTTRFALCVLTKQKRLTRPERGWYQLAKKRA